jgi:2-C-methyl-D-erythritol 4-phosphate cytidylyltransferase
MGPRVAAVVVAGGAGSRFGGPKQFAELAGQSVAARSIAAARSVADVVVLVAPAGASERHGADLLVEGGVTRAESVRAGLRMLDRDVEVVVVHDAARPLATPALFEACLAALEDPGVDGAVCAVEVTDTIKRVATRDGRRQVVETLARAELVAVQTPQAFRAGVLAHAHASGEEATDDAALVEAVGGIVVVVPGDADNLKLTRPEDLSSAAAILERR